MRCLLRLGVPNFAWQILPCPLTIPKLGLRSILQQFGLIFSNFRNAEEPHCENGIEFNENVDDGDQQGQRVEQYPRGYPRLAALQNSDPVFSMFRKFGLLHCRSLLLQQDELYALEKRLEEVDQAEHTQLYLSSRLYDENPDRISLLKEIRQKLKQYDGDLLRFLRLSECNVPSQGNIESFSRWMDAVKPLIKPETHFLRYTDDFVTTDRDVEDGILEDIVEKFARRYGTGDNFLKTKKEHRKTIDPDLHYYSAARKQVVVRLLLTGLASALLLFPTILLFVVGNTVAGLVVISFFTLIFAFAIALLTRAKRHEIFAATAAFLAVLVVFVSNIP